MTAAAVAISWLQKLIGFAPKAAAIAEKIDPALARSATLANILAGAKVGAALPWADIEKVIAQKMADPLADVQTAEEIAKDVAMIFPPAMYAADGLAIVGVLIQLGDTLPPGWAGTPLPNLPYKGDGINPYSGAPIGV